MRPRTALRSTATLKRLLLIALACGALPASAGRAGAAACGDDVEGKRVACACGDVVVSDTVLWTTDPVATEPCPDDGLTIVAAAGIDHLTLNLGGQSIVGRGHGAGIRVVRGGRLGAVIVGGDEDDARAEIARFGTGIRATGRDVLSVVRSVDIHDNTGDGLYVRASGAKLEDVHTTGNGRDGARLSGHGNELSRVTARSNARDGVAVRGSGSTVSADTSANGRNGAAIGGRGHEVDRLVTMDNGGAGVSSTGNGHDLGKTKSFGNAGGDLRSPDGARP